MKRPVSSGSMYKAATSGRITQLHQVIDLVDSGASPERIREWCEKRIARCEKLLRAASPKPGDSEQ